MRVFDRKIPFILLIGDIVCFLASLWLTLFIRYRELPDYEVFQNHLAPFTLLFLLWVLVFYIAGFYEKPTVTVRARLLETLLYAQAANALLAVLFFYFVTSPNITPKTTLLIYIGVSSLVMFWWRSYGYSISGVRKHESALLLGGGKDMEDLKNEVNRSSHYNIRFVEAIDVERTPDAVEAALRAVTTNGVSVLVVDLHNDKVAPMLPSLYNLIFSKVRFIDMAKVYEDVFDRMPLSLLKESWFLEHVSIAPKVVYDGLKRFMDIALAAIGGILTLPFYPIVALAIKLDDGGPVFIFQKRIGKDGRVINIPKFRSMKGSDGGKWVTEGDDRITRVGKFLRAARIDEFPQFWSVVKGDMSFTGPRPDIQDLGTKLSYEIPYYNIRNVLKPGLSGWAQIKQDLPPQSLEETKLRLAYDFYYIKNRSLALDLKIALKTIKTFLSRAGR